MYTCVKKMAVERSLVRFYFPVMALSLSIWHRYIRDSTTFVRKSEDAVEANRMLKFHIDVSLDSIIASVQASMKNRSYDVFVQYGERGIILSIWHCPLANVNVSRTYNTKSQ